LIPYLEESPLSSELERHKFAIEKLVSSGTFFFPSRPDDMDGWNALLVRSDPVSESWSDQFLWNRELMSNFDPTSHRNGLRIISPLINGYYQTRQLDIHVSVTLVTRKSTYQAGTRFNARGIDDDGHVAIFCESEFIIKTDTSPLWSYTIIRGSVPLFWSQQSNTGSIEFDRNFEMTKKSFESHIKQVQEQYGSPIVFVNLLSNSKSGECGLSSRMGELIDWYTAGLIGKCELSLIQFDFHKHVNQSKAIDESLSPLMDQLRPFIFHSIVPNGGTSATNRRGILRVNCLDCLDRTNIVQMMICLEALSFASPTLAINFSTHRDVIVDMWIKNGDAISRGYSGTGSVLSRLVKNAGKSTSSAQISTVLEHSWRSANRYIKGNWDDEERNDAMLSLIRGGHSQVHRKGGDGHHSVHIDVPPEISIWIGTWNIHGSRLDEEDGNFSGWLPTHQLSDILVFNFQEVIDLNGMSVIFNSRGDEDRNRAIDMEIFKHLSINDFMQVSVVSMVGLYTCIFARRSMFDGHIDMVRTNRLKAGFGGATGNKGSIAISFRIFKSVDIEVLNIHLDSGEFRAEERMNQLGYILSSASTSRHGLRVSEKHDKLVVLAGDFNFRCDGIDPLLALELIDRNRVEKLRSFDPFLSRPSNILKTNGFKEMPLLFDPTYKFDIANSGGKRLSDKRIPSWCDRVFYRYTGAKLYTLEPRDYSSVPSLCLSDHKPVFARFSLKRSTPPVHRPPIKKPPLLIDLLSGDTASSPISEMRMASSSGTGDWILTEYPAHPDGQQSTSDAPSGQQTGQIDLLL
jgi:inositol-1,4,5-trisphosphate 5-phosphatase